MKVLAIGMKVRFMGRDFSVIGAKEGRFLIGRPGEDVKVVDPPHVELDWEWSGYSWRYESEGMRASYGSYDNPHWAVNDLRKERVGFVSGDSKTVQEAKEAAEAALAVLLSARGLSLGQRMVAEFAASDEMVAAEDEEGDDGQAN